MGFVYILYVIVAVVSIYTIYCAKKKLGFWCNHYFLTNLWWITSLALTFFFRSFHTQLNIDIYFIFLFGLLSYNCTLFFLKTNKNESSIEQQFLDLNKRRIIELIVIITLLPAAYNNYDLYMSGTELWELNREYWDINRSTGNYLYLVFIQNLIEPMSILLVGTCFYKLYINKGKYSDYITILLSFIISVLNMIITGGGRTGIAIFMMILFLSVIASRNQRFTKFIVYIPLKYCIVGILIGAILVTWASTGRGNLNATFFDVIVERMTLFAPLFNHYYSSTDVFQEYTFGASMFEFIFVFLSYPLKALGIETDFQRIGEIVQSFVYLPSLNKMSNASVTSYLFYLRDFGILGVFLGPFLVANIFNYVYSSVSKKSFFLFFYLTIMLRSCMSIAYPFDRGFCFVLISLYLFYKFCKINNNPCISQ